MFKTPSEQASRQSNAITEQIKAFINSGRNRIMQQTVV